MKKALFIYVSLAAIVAGSFASCQEEEMGFDYATIKHSVYDRDFLKEFGDPAPNHQWGFDIATSLLNINSPLTRTDEAYVKKQDMMINGVKLTVAYEKPKDIQTNEHAEVAAWFRNHKVTWLENPAGFDGSHSTLSATGIAVAQVATDDASYGSLRNHPNPLGDYTFGSSLLFHNGWMQHVYSRGQEDISSTLQCCMADGTPILTDGTSQYIEKDGQVHKIDKDNNNNDLGAVDIDKKTLTPLTNTLKTSNQMDQMGFLGYTEDGHFKLISDINEFNGGKGYGWNLQSGQNAIFILDSDFNTFRYHGSNDSQWHDKYYCVYLEGDGYAGYYLGFDFESNKRGDSNLNSLLADGYADDWIIKICDAGPNQYNPARIFCEDLGTNDFDFNDVVMDVTVNEQNDGKQVATVTVKAVGGTIPVCVCYGEHPYDIESAAFRFENKHELHEIFGAAVNQPINVNAPNGMTSSKEVSWKLQFGSENKNNDTDYYYPDQRLDLQKINIYVKHSDKAEWLLVRNYDLLGAVSAPQKFCAPTEVMWPDECVPIRTKYPRFKDWVENPVIKFWTSGNTSSGGNGQTAIEEPSAPVGIPLNNSVWPNYTTLPTACVSALQEGKEVVVEYTNAVQGSKIALQSSWSNNYQEKIISGSGTVKFTLPSEAQTAYGEQILRICCSLGAFNIVSCNVVSQ